MKKLTLLFVAMTVLFINGSSQNIGINATGALPDAKAMLDIASTTTGLLIPRMTTTQRDAITTPPNGLQIYNTTTNTLEIYKGVAWQALAYSPTSSNLINVYSLADLPTPVGNAITLDASKMYVFSGIINISPNYLNLNGAGLRGVDPGKDGVMSTVSGGVLRSTGVSVFIENLAVIPASGSTKAYDFADATGTKYCNIFSGSSVVEIGIPSLGVGQISGFQAITTVKNYWNCSDGMKVTGNVGKFASAYNFIIGINGGAGIEFLSGLTINDIDLSNNYFIYPGNTGVKVNAGATIDRGRMTTNMFRGVGTYTNGFDSYTPEWEMRQNTGIPNSRAFGFIFMSGNTSSTTISAEDIFYKIAGTTSSINTKRFTAATNRLTYTGKDPITVEVTVVMGAKAPSNGSDFTIAIAKNGTIIPTPNGSMATATNNQSFQITLITELGLITGDYLEVFIRNNNGTTNIIVEELQFRITD